MSGLRQAEITDAKAIARIEIETWRATYPGMLPDRVLLGMSELRQTQSWASFLRSHPEDVLVAEGGRGEILGFGNCGVPRERAIAGYEGEIYTLYVHPDAQGRGHGRALLHGLFGRLLDAGYGSALIWVVRANPSRFFYERAGGRQAMHRKIPVGGAPVEAIAYGWRDLAALLNRRARQGIRNPGPGKRRPEP